MTATKPAPAPAAKTILSGWCGSGYHERCRGHYGGYPCDCEHHTAAEPVLEQPPTPPPAPARHCATCTCEDPR